MILFVPRWLGCTDLRFICISHRDHSKTQPMTRRNWSLKDIYFPKKHGKTLFTKPSASAGARVLRPYWWHQRWPYWWQRVVQGPGQWHGCRVSRDGWLFVMYDPIRSLSSISESVTFLFLKTNKITWIWSRKYQICYINISLAGFRRLARVRTLKRQTDDFIDNSWPKKVAWTQALPSDWIRIWNFAECIRKTMHNVLWVWCFSGLEG